MGPLVETRPRGVSVAPVARAPSVSVASAATVRWALSNICQTNGAGLAGVQDAVRGNRWCNPQYLQAFGGMSPHQAEGPFWAHNPNVAPKPHTYVAPSFEYCHSALSRVRIDT